MQELPTKMERSMMDMQARFLRISELLESFGPQRVGLPHVPVGVHDFWQSKIPV
jgi:hypothetical protein